ncbi:hypothetical protein LOTGIDRAFT_171916 [Lottia gigantea]|uniref:G-protein coupled receptors family 1 profile domain-containing protein n=1 Tax=Lottia gigantea TaxID=225164 RepID=V4AEY1_LOTGI|nr:hypothetical protein LOTGIDRAFT_171916 [Lottia gigantea]ESP02594.1 hypothetical protein LOTGIDRAFT_171916 [Lottia gigantea]
MDFSSEQNSIMFLLLLIPIYMVAAQETSEILDATDLDGGVMNITDPVTDSGQQITNGNATMNWENLETEEIISAMGNEEFHNRTNDSVVNTTSKMPAIGGFISKEIYDQAIQITQNIWLPVCCIGLVTNILNIVVFLDREMRKSATSLYLVGISLLQITYFIVTSIRRIPPLIYGEYAYTKTKFYLLSVIYLSNYFGAALTRTVYCLVMLVAFERMMAILFPMKLAKTRLVKSPIICMICLIIVSMTFHVYLALSFYLSETIGEDGIVKYGMIRTDFDPVVINRFSMAAKIIFVYIPIIGLFVFNVVLCVALKRSFKTRKSLQESRSDRNQEKRERQTTIAILVTTCIFFVLSLPMPINSIVVNLVPEYNYFNENRYTFLFVQEVGSLLSIVSYCVDFVTYLIISSRYRLTLMKKCLPCRYHLKSKIHSTNTQVSGKSLSTGSG